MLNLRADYSVKACHGRLIVTVFNQNRYIKIVSETAILATQSLSITLTLIVIESVSQTVTVPVGWYTCHINIYTVYYG